MTDSEAIVCVCGAILLDDLTGREAVVGGERIPFGRTTDYVLCDECGRLHRIRDLLQGDAGGAGAAVDELARLDDPAGRRDG